MEYQTCSWNINCDEFGVARDCRNLTCQSGCFCSNGYVLEEGVCVHPDMCTSKWKTSMQQRPLATSQHLILIVASSMLGLQCE